MSNEIKVRRATVEDVPALTILFEAYRKWYRREANAQKAQLFLLERLTNNESVLFVATDTNHELVGFTQLYPIFSSTRLQRVWLLNDLFVHENHRGKHISKLLMQVAKEFAEATGSCGITLETEKSNTVGNNLYPKMDFELDTEHNMYNWEIIRSD